MLWRNRPPSSNPAMATAMLTPNAARSQSRWKTGSAGSTWTGPKPAMPPRSWMPSMPREPPTGRRRRLGRDVHSAAVHGELHPGAAGREQDGRAVRVGVARGLVHVGAAPAALHDLAVGEHPHVALPGGLTDRARRARRGRIDRRLHDDVGRRDLR